MTIATSPTPAPLDWRNLIQAGRELLNPRPAGNLPTDEHTRRAVSNAYYAMFHALADSNASALIGPPNDAATAAAWSRVYRGLDHTTARRELQRHRQEFSAQGQAFANNFGEIQQFRHSADYDHNVGFTAQEAIAHLDRAQAAILDYTQTALSERVYIATLTLVRPR